MDDDGPDFWQYQQQLEEQQWLADAAAQREYQSWLDQLNSKDSRKWDDTQVTPAAATSNPHPRARTLPAASN